MKALLLALLLPACAGAQDWRFSPSVNYETGKYGGGASVDTVYVPLTLKRYFRNTDLAVTVPWLSQSSAGQVTRVGGRPVRSAGRTAPRSGANSGLGDILVRGSYQVKRDGPGSFDFALGGRLKLPTANEEKGLGTGELDQGAGFEFGKELNPRWTLLADGYYTIIGDPAGVDFNNNLELSVGVWHPVDDRVSVTVLYETSSALIDGAADPRSLRAELAVKRGAAEGLTFGLGLGFSEGSPALSTGAGLWKRF